MSKEKQLVAEDITADQLQDEQIVEDVEVSEQEETTEITSEESAETVEEAADASKEVNGVEAEKETVASIKKSASKKAEAPKTKAGLINASYKAMSQMTKEQLSAFYETLVTIPEETIAEDSDVTAEEVVAEEAQVEVKIDFQADLNALVSEQEDLSEDFKDKAAVIFEAAVKSKISEEIDRLEEQYATDLTEEVTQVKTELAEKVDGYLSYVVEQWMEENKVAVEVGLRAEIAESFINGLKGLFEQHYVEVPESKYDLVDDLATKVGELEEQLNKSTEDNIKLNEQVSDLRRDQIIAEATAGMVEIDAAKLKNLVEDVDFETAETFSKKVSIVKESYFKAKKVQTLDESTEIATDEKGTLLEASGPMSKYVTALSRTTK
jgi:hypothetical protein